MCIDCCSHWARKPGQLDIEQCFHYCITPTYPAGLGTGIGMSRLSAVAATVLLVELTVENKRRDQGKRDYRLESEDAENLGDSYPNFRYTL